MGIAAKEAWGLTSMAKKIKKSAKRLNIKNRKADRLARKLAKMTGETITTAVIVALQERLKIILEREARLKAMRKISAETAKLLKGPPIDHAEMLYDENGLPK
jgi:antitoxin VapB